jgi:slime mold repeat-containing protein
MTNARVVVLVFCAGLAARPALAGGPGPDERQLVIGNCSGAACTWDCNGQTDPVCAKAADTCDLPSGDFAARIRFTVDDQVCSGTTGSHMTVALAGQKADGTPFTIPDTTFDFCGLTDQDLACGGSLGLCEGTTIPRATVFSCTTFLPDGVLDEQSIPDSSWLQFSDFLPAVADALKAQFPGVAGEPFIVSSTDKSFTSDPGAGPSTRDVCITGAFIQPSGAIDVPAAIGSLQSTTATASLAIGDCPTLPVPTTTSTTETSTTTLATTTTLGATTTTLATTTTEASTTTLATTTTLASTTTTLATTTTTVAPTTTTTLPTCGNGVVDQGEPCDPSSPAGALLCPPGDVCTAQCTCVSTTTTTTTTQPASTTTATVVTTTTTTATVTTSTTTSPVSTTTTTVSATTTTAPLTTTTAASTTTTTTVPAACQMAAECDDGDPCTTDTCEAGACVHTPLTGGDLIVCLVAGSADACANERVPRGFEQKVDVAAAMVDRALLRHPGARRALLAVARGQLVLAEARLGHAKGLSAACVDQLEQGLAQAIAFIDSLGPATHPGGHGKPH